MVPLFKNTLDLVFEKVPNMPRSCPILPGKYYNENLTIVSPEMIEEYQKLIRLITDKGILPNGVYRNFLKYYSNDVPVGIAYYYNVEVNFRMNEDRF